jgi:hypothetical protein
MSRRNGNVVRIKSDLRVFYRGFWVPPTLLSKSVRKKYKQTKLYNCEEHRPMSQTEILREV